MVPYYSVYFISYINISHVILEKVVGYIVSNFVDFLNRSIFHKNIFQQGETNLIICSEVVARSVFFKS